MGLTRLYRRGRAFGSRAKSALFPTREVEAWKRACRLAEETPRYRPGQIDLMDYRLRYCDLMTLCPQWHDIFVRQTHRVHLDAARPTILDCGANVGLASLYFKKLFPDARVTAYEADPRIVEVLRANLTENGASDVEAVHAAVWTSDGEARFISEGADSGTMEAVGGVSGSVESVPSVRLRDVIAAREVSILKLDIEGAEEEVLADCADVLGNVGVIIAEVHELDPKRLCTPRVLTLLGDAGFTVSMDDLVPMPWREPRADPESPFPGLHLCWGSLVRAWRQ